MRRIRISWGAGDLAETIENRTEAPQTYSLVISDHVVDADVTLKPGESRKALWNTHNIPLFLLQYSMVELVSHDDDLDLHVTYSPGPPAYSPERKELHETVLHLSHPTDARDFVIRSGVFFDATDPPPGFVVREKTWPEASARKFERRSLRGAD